MYETHAVEFSMLWLLFTWDAFFWDYSGIGILRIDGICVLLGAIPFSEYHEWISWMNIMNERNIIPFILLPIAELTEWKECSLLGQNTRSFGKYLAGNPTRAPCSLTLKCVCRYSSSQVTSDIVSRSETCRSVLFEIEIPCILLFLNQNKNSQNSPKRMHPWVHDRKIVQLCI